MEALRITIRLPEGSRYYRVSAQHADLPACLITYTLQRTIPSVRRPITTSSPHRSNCQYRNINLLSIGISFRINLRARLTLIRLALIRNPWSFGVRVSHPHYRYLCLHLLFQTLQHSSRYTFGADWNAPLPIITNSIASVICLCPVIIHAQPLD